MLDDRLATLATLIDEGIDMVNGGSTAPIAEAMPDLKELLTVALLNRFTIGSEHGSEKEPKDRQVSENNPSQKKEAESQPIERSTDSSPIEHID